MDNFGIPFTRGFQKGGSGENVVNCSSLSAPSFGRGRVRELFEMFPVAVKWHPKSPSVSDGRLVGGTYAGSEASRIACFLASEKVWYLSKTQWNNPWLFHLTTMSSQGLFRWVLGFNHWLTSLSAVSDAAFPFWLASVNNYFLITSFAFPMHSPCIFLCTSFIWNGSLGSCISCFFGGEPYLYIGITSSDFPVGLYLLFVSII